MFAVRCSLFALLTLPGCRSTTIGEGPVYPSEAPRVETLDVQVIRRGTKVELTNTTAREFAGGTLWLNGWWGRPIDHLRVGETLTLSLWEFRDQHAGKFRAGGFFARERPDKIVLAELQTEGGLLALVVVDPTGD